MSVFSDDYLLFFDVKYCISNTQNTKCSLLFGTMLRTVNLYTANCFA